MSVRERALAFGALPARKRQMIASATLLRDQLRSIRTAQIALFPDTSLAGGS
jgi:hypothetical protein